MFEHGPFNPILITMMVEHVSILPESISVHDVYVLSNVLSTLLISFYVVSFFFRVVNLCCHVQHRKIYDLRLHHFMRGRIARGGAVANVMAVDIIREQGSMELSMGVPRRLVYFMENPNRT